VIADGQRAVGLAGVMGGGNSEVQDSTTRVYLECAEFSRPRSAGRRLSINGGRMPRSASRKASIPGTPAAIARLRS